MQAMTKGRFFKSFKFIPTIPSFKHKSQNQKFQVSIDHHRINNKYVAELVFENSEHVKLDEEAILTPSTEDQNEEFDKVELEFEDKCPPGGENMVIFYTTSLRGIRKTFEECQSIKFLLESLRVLYSERDVSFHLEYRDELWEILGGGSRVIPPKLFIKGRYIGGADEVIGLHEQGKLKRLLEGIPVKVANRNCSGCGNLRFVVCLNCNGSRKVSVDGEESCDEPFVRCNDCNENGLVKCPIC
ncbi:hypothetical protein ACFE04_020882 [Oxalis oulophora]